MLENELDVWLAEAKLQGKACRNFSNIRAYYTDVESDEEVIDILSRIASAHHLQLRESNRGEEIIIWFYQTNYALDSVSMFG